MMNATIMSCFKTGESNLEHLITPLHEQYFEVLKPTPAQKAVVEMEEVRMRILYCLYHLKQQVSKQSNQPFQDYLKKFLREKAEDDESRFEDATSQHSMQTGLSFMVVMMSEFRDIGNIALIEKMLTQYVQLFKGVKPGSFFNGNLQSYKLDSSLNEARIFLMELVDDQKTNMSTRILCVKMLLMIGLARGSIEDFLILFKIINEQAKKGVFMDLVPEL
jgi:hypothetical protein